MCSRSFSGGWRWVVGRSECPYLPVTHWNIVERYLLDFGVKALRLPRPVNT